jgi:D-alanyl-D-alanine carboxypeptidase
MDDYQQQVALILQQLNIPLALIEARGLVLCPEPLELVLAEQGADGREHRLIPAAAAAWLAMKQAALADGIELYAVSAFRDLARQRAIIENKIARGMPMETILALSAPPGYSEHHSGRAIDIGTPGSTPTEEEFETTAAFAWLSRHAGRFGFRLSFPRGNALGYIYEPWHWYYHGTA